MSRLIDSNEPRPNGVVQSVRSIMNIRNIIDPNSSSEEEGDDGNVPRVIANGGFIHDSASEGSVGNHGNHSDSDDLSDEEAEMMLRALFRHDSGYNTHESGPGNQNPSESSGSSDESSQESIQGDQDPIEANQGPEQGDSGESSQESGENLGANTQEEFEFESQSDESQEQARLPAANLLNYRHLHGLTSIFQTPFASKIDLVADYQDPKVLLTSDETYGATSNLYKTVAAPHQIYYECNEEDQFLDGWLVKRHEDMSHATLKFGASGIVRGIDIDLTGYTQRAPLTASVFCVSKENAFDWESIMQNVPLVANAHNFFELTNNNRVHSYVHLTVTPGGGVRRFRCYGDVVVPMDRNEFNLASTKHGAEILAQPTDIIRGEFPNIIIDRKLSSHDGWISPRARIQPPSGSEYTIIKLATEGIIDRFVVDTTHFIGNAPRRVSLEGCRIVEQDGIIPNPVDHEDWINLIDDQEDGIGITNNTINIVPCPFDGPITHIRYRPIPDGGVQQIQVQGNIFAPPPVPIQNRLGPIKKRKRDNDDDDDEDDEPSTSEAPIRKSARTRKPVLRYQ